MTAIALRHKLLLEIAHPVEQGTEIKHQSVIAGSETELLEKALALSSRLTGKVHRALLRRFLKGGEDHAYYIEVAWTKYLDGDTSPANPAQAALQRAYHAKCIAADGGIAPPLP